VDSDHVRAADIDPGEAARLIASGAFLLDVREDSEWEAGHAPEAVQVAMGLVSERIDEIPKDRTVLCICRAGGRSGTVATTLASAGYDALNIAGGMLAWEHAGLSVVTDDGDTGRIL